MVYCLLRLETVDCLKNEIFHIHYLLSYVSEGTLKHNSTHYFLDLSQLLLDYLYNNWTIPLSAVILKYYIISGIIPPSDMEYGTFAHFFKLLVVKKWLFVSQT